MGIYLNPGCQAFEIALHSDIYIDKTNMITCLNILVKTNKRYISISRPRRFGKTMAADMLCAYYGKSEENRALFENTKLALQDKWDTYLGKFDVIRLNMIDFLTDSETITDMISYLTEEVTFELMDSYPDVRYGSRINLRNVCNKIYAATKTQFVIVIDEWDAIFRTRKSDKEGQTEYLNFLRDWLKDKEYVALAYMTGILPIKKYGEHSALNMFTEYSMTQPMQLAPYTGFTEEEVKELCAEYKMDYNAVSDWYDGYLINDRIPVASRELYQKGKYKGNKIHIYSPLSVVMAMDTGYIRNYWNKTETYEALAEYIRMNLDGLKDAVVLMMEGGRVRVNTNKFQNDMTTFHSRDDVLTLLIHLGYLGYDDETEEVFIPNKEIRDEFKASTDTVDWEPVFQAYKTSEQLLEATWTGNEERIAELMESAHDQAENKTYNSEAALSYAIQLAYYAAGKYYTTVQELDTGKGYADLVYLPSPRYPEKPALLIELKYEKNADTALNQIKDKKYPDKLAHYQGNILLVGINYDKEAAPGSPDYKKHSCRIERA